MSITSLHQLLKIHNQCLNSNYKKEVILDMAKFDLFDVEFNRKGH